MFRLQHRRCRLALVACVALLACGGDDFAPSDRAPPTSPVRVRGPELGGGDDAGPPPPGDAGQEGPSIAFEEPADGAVFARDAVRGHTWVAEIVARVRAAGV